MTQLQKLHFLHSENNNYAFQYFFRKLAKKNIHPGQTLLLHTLKLLGPCSQREAADHLNVSTASVAVSIKRLEKAGYVIKQPSETDLRYNVISLTPAGRQICKETEQITNALTALQLEGFTKEEINQLLDFLTRINQNLKADHEKATQASNPGQEPNADQTGVMQI